MKTRFTSMDTNPDTGSLLVFDILELGDAERSPKQLRAHLMRQFGRHLNELLDGSITQIVVGREED